MMKTFIAIGSRKGIAKFEAVDHQSAKHHIINFLDCSQSWEFNTVGKWMVLSEEERKRK